MKNNMQGLQCSPMLYFSDMDSVKASNNNQDDWNNKLLLLKVLPLD